MYSSHNYSPPSTTPGPYPGKIGKEMWNKRRQTKIFADGEGTKFTAQNEVPLWVGEFGAGLTGSKADNAHRLHSLDDQISIFEAQRAHWTIWTYKDIGMMGLVAVDPDSDYLRLMRPVLRAKRTLGVDSWLNRGTPKTLVEKSVDRMAALAEKTIGDKGIDHPSNRRTWRRRCSPDTLPS